MRMTSIINKSQLQIFIILDNRDVEIDFNCSKFKYLQNHGIKLDERLKLIQNQGQFLQFIPYLCIPQN